MSDPYVQFMKENGHPAVRDLAWVIGSPSMIDGESPEFAGHAVSDSWREEHFCRFLPHLITLTSDPSPLSAWLQSRSTQRLGRYFESLVSYWLSHAPGLADVRESLQVKRGKVTLGEFDFLFFDQVLNENVHLEVAVKFYLRHGKGNSWDQYIGPYGKDRLDLKLQLLFGKQVLLGETDEGRKTLSVDGQMPEFRSLALVKGYLFDPLTEFGLSPESSTSGLSSRCLRGYWVTEENLADVVRRSPESLWSIVPKLEWLSPSFRERSHGMLTADTLLQVIFSNMQSDPKPILIAELQESSRRNTYGEVARAFIVPSHWPR